MVSFARGLAAVLSMLLLMVISNAVLPVPSRADTGDSRMVLSGPWTLQSTESLTASGTDLSQPDYASTGWMPAKVPGTVLDSYVHDGKYPEPYFDLNNKIDKGLIPDASVPGSVFTHPHWYRTVFTLDPSYAGKTVWLDFNGINYKADIYLNGKPVGHMAGMFKRGMLDVTGVATVGKNALAVEIFPLDTPGTPHGQGCGGDGKIGQNAATMYATIGWDFTIVDGIRDRNMGIYRSVEVVKTGPVRIRDPFMITDSVPAPGTSGAATLRFKTTLINATAQPVRGVLHLKIRSDEGAAIPVEQPVTLQPNERREIELTSSDHPSLIIQNPRLWWPVPIGKPELYHLNIAFITDGGTESDLVHCDFGIRTIARDTDFHGQNRFTVNGRHVFIQGGNWVQDAMLRATAKSYEAQLRHLAGAGVNMLRCWSASAPESDEFFDLCDKYGIMAWVESGAAAQVWGASDVQMQLDNWADTVLRVRNHPCVAYYCGCNEGGPVAGTQETTAKYDDTRQYQDSSQANGQRGCPYRYIGTNTLYDYTAKDLFGSGPLGPMGGFCNETGTPALPPAEVLRGMIDEDNLWPVKNNPGFDAAIDYHDGGGFHQMRSFINTGCAEFGAFDQPDLGGRVGIDNYAFKGQILGAMDFRAMSEVWKRNKWDTEHGRYDTGYCLWTINNANPMAAGRLTNYTGEPNAALFYYAHGNKPVHAQYDYYYNDISVINDLGQPIPGLRVHAEIRNLDWSLKWSSDKTINADADTSQTAVIPVPAKDTADFDPVHFIVVKLYDATGKLIDNALYWRSAEGPKYGADGPFVALNAMPIARLNVKSSVVSSEGRQTVTVALANPTDALAFFTRVKIYRAHAQTLVQPTHYSDNYVSLEPGERRTITLDYDASDLNGEPAQLVVEGWNTKTARFSLGASGETPQGANTFKYVPAQRSISLQQPVTASSVESDAHPASAAVDGDPGSRWASQIGVDPQWITVDLGTSQAIGTMTLNWEAAAAKDYQVQTSDDNATWTTVKSVTGNTSDGPVTFSGLNAHGRYVRIYCTARVTPYGYSLYEISVYGK